MTAATLSSSPSAATVTKAKPKKQKQAKLAADLSAGYDLLGEVVTWKAAGPHAYPSVVQALKDCGLDEKAARERLPRHAFARALKTLAQDKVVDILAEDKDTIKFQFSGKQLVEKEEGQEIAYAKEHFLTLAKESGILACKDENLRAKAQSLLDQHLVERTTGDITTIVQKLFDQHADLIPIRDQGGAYFVFAQHLPFVGGIQEFLGKLGGKVNRLPVPAGTQTGDQTVQECLQDYLGKLVTSHEEAVKNFDVHTREGTLAEAAERINLTRNKIEAYASLLSEKSAELVAAAEAAKGKLLEKVAAIAQAKKDLPEEEVGKDKFGCLVGGVPARINKAMTGEYQDIKAIAAAAQVDPGRALNHLKYWAKKKGFFEEGGKGSWRIKA